MQVQLCISDLMLSLEYVCRTLVKALFNIMFFQLFILNEVIFISHVTMATVIQVNELAEDPTKLWDKIKSKQKQKKPELKYFTTKLKEKPDNAVRFVLISDTHNKTDSLTLPDGDVLLHAGDFTKVGNPSEVKHFNDFLGRVKHQFEEIIVICGNHELTFDPEETRVGKMYLSEATRQISHKELKEQLTNCRYIEDETINVKGFNIYGSPWQPEFGGWAYNLKRGEQCLEKWNLIPDDTDILITHGPALGYGDLCSSGFRAGCSELLSTIQQRVKPQLHLFGHIHEAYGIWRDKDTTYVNASICTLSYKPVNLPIVVDLKPPSRK